MEWIQSINKAIEYMETHLTEDIHCEDVAGHVHISVFHFQRTFTLFTGMSVGEYLRKRRLSLAGEELTKQGTKVIDVACAKVRVRFAGKLYKSIYPIPRYHAESGEKGKRAEILQ